ncbi:hypothetical protein Anapl_10777 [Anas platyrhynchos]|uniref:Uncharacterized protein n=1 Tax=Anas platyrhynchos TaxID=8839 RepID=R0K0V8_ANAPL|nr:hypothetical protein Anapl_10777 [Anas platyrhynchos]
MAHGEGAAFGVSSKGRIPGYVTTCIAALEWELQTDNPPSRITEVLALGSPSATSCIEQDYPQHQVKVAAALASHKLQGQVVRQERAVRIALESAAELSPRAGGQQSREPRCCVWGWEKKPAAAFTLPSSCRRGSKTGCGPRA